MRPVKNSLYDYAINNNLQHLIDEYSDENPLTCKEIGFDSTIEVIWICNFGHRVIESPHKRVRRGYCPYCGKLRNGSFAQNFPDSVPLWDKNNKLDPHKTPPTYSDLILWKCKHGHKWKRKISLQVKLNSCPVCEIKGKGLFDVRPELLKLWDNEKNEHIDTSTILAYSNKNYYWLCEKGHSFTAAPEAFMRRNIKCPICSSAGFANPMFLKEWHPDKNGGKTAYDYSANSQKQAWFICSSCGKEYSSRIAARVARKTNKCPNCR